MDEYVDALLRIRGRVAALTAAGTPPFEAVMCPEEWASLKAAHWVHLGHSPQAGVTGAEVIGARVRVIPGTRGCVLRYADGVEFEPVAKRA